MFQRLQFFTRPKSQDTTNSFGSKAGTANNVIKRSSMGLPDIVVSISSRYLELCGDSSQGLGCSAERIFPRFRGARVRVVVFPLGGLIFIYKCGEVQYL